MMLRCKPSDGFPRTHPYCRHSRNIAVFQQKLIIQTTRIGRIDRSTVIFCKLPRRFRINASKVVRCVFIRRTMREFKSRRPDDLSLQALRPIGQRPPLFVGIHVQGKDRLIVALGNNSLNSSGLNVMSVCEI